jgi:hypothetical protein
VRGCRRSMSLWRKPADARWMAVVTWGAAAAGGWALQCQACPFGAVGSVWAWERLGLALQLILGRLFGLCIPRYVDDLFRAIAATVGRAQHAAAAESRALREVLVDILGWALDDAKSAAERLLFPRPSSSVRLARFLRRRVCQKLSFWESV